MGQIDRAAITAENFPDFKKLYIDAVRYNEEKFEFMGQPVLTAYAKYVITYFEGGTAHGAIH